MNPAVLKAYRGELLRFARSVSRRTDDDEDLLQLALLVALEAGRADLSSQVNRRWIKGVMRNLARSEARAAARRRAREEEFATRSVHSDAVAAEDPEFISGLPTRLRLTARLILSGCTRADIRYLLNIEDAALRQRISQLRRRWRLNGGDPQSEFSALIGDHPFGVLRRNLLVGLRARPFELGAHDPDGHGVYLCSQITGPRQQ